MSKNLMISLINKGTAKMLQWVQKRIQEAKTYISISLQTDTKLVNGTVIDCIRQFSFQ